MKNNLNILYLSTCIPRKCGIATFTHDLSTNVAKVAPDSSYGLIAMHESAEVNRNYGAEVVMKINTQGAGDYLKAADFINNSGADILSIQHEFGIYGGANGEYLIRLMENVRIPLAVSFHTTPVFPTANKSTERMPLLKKISDLSDVTIITSEIARRSLVNIFGFKPAKLSVIHHGTPVIQKLSKKARTQLKSRLNLETGPIMITFGLISPGKGLEYGIRAMKETVKAHPDLTYIIIGEMHPSKKAIPHEGFENYLAFLRHEIEANGLTDKVRIIEKYMPENELIQYLQSSDILLTPYLTAEQVSSGVLSWGTAAGLCLVTTPFLYAQDIAGQDRGLFCEYRSSESIASILNRLLNTPGMIEKHKSLTAEVAPSIVWPKIARQYFNVFKGLNSQTKRFTGLKD